MFGSVKKFVADRRGAFAIQFALLAVPLTVCTGLAVDGGRAFLARFELASALDAAALAVGSTYSENADINTVAHKFVNANFRSPHQGEISLELENLDDEEETVILKGTVTIDTYFMPLVGQPTVTVSAESEVKRGGANVEVSLVLDITGSMGGSRIEDLREAAADLVDIVVNDVQTPFYSKVAIAPYSMAVNTGAYADAVRGAAAGPVTVTGAEWRDGWAKSISGSTGWRKNNGGEAISNVTWRNGSRKAISGITRASEAVVTANSHGYSNGDFVTLYGVSGMTQVNGDKYLVSVVDGNNFKIKNPVTDTFVNSSGYGAYSSSSNDYAQECFNAGCEIRVTTTSHDYDSGDFVYLNGVGSPYGGVNNAAGSSWTISSLTAPTSTVFFLAGSNGPGVTTSTNSADEGTASECHNATCDFIVTASSHGFANGDFVYVTGASTSGTATSMNNSLGSTWTIEDVATNTFTLPGNGPSYRDWSSGGTASECFTDGCEVKVTAAGHGLSNDQYTQISGVSGMTDLNKSGNSSWKVEGVSGDTFILSGSEGPDYSNYSSGGQSQCLAQGCEKFRFTNADGNTRIFPISACATERTGANAYTDVAPTTTLVGRNYESTGNPCPDSSIVPLSSDKDMLTDHIEDMDAQGSTAGHLGIAWGWYLLSPNFSYLFPTANQPAAYEAPRLAKVAVLMTDGEFNTVFCNGVLSQASTSGSGSDSDKINCDPLNGSPFDQAVDLCDGMKAAGIKVYTVGFDIASGGGAQQALNDCATDADHVYTADDGEELKAAFKTIAREISKLRIAR